VLVLLPPSETKREGGTDANALDFGALRFPELTRHRKTTVAALGRLSKNVAASTAALGLGPKQRFEVDRNRELTRSPVMPVMDRFTGVLYEALDAPALDDTARAWLERNVVVHSALFGLVGAGDPIPAYRLSHDSRLTTAANEPIALKKHWRDAIADVLAAEPGLIVDLRSEGYVALGPAPERDNSVYLRVVTAGPDGTRRALNHFNKKGKGEFVRALAEAAVDHDSVDALLGWAAGAGIRLERSTGSTGSTGFTGREILELLV